jgi:hypothetical protein
MAEAKKNWVQQAVSTISRVKGIPDGLFELPPFPIVKPDGSQAILLAFCRRQQLAAPDRLVAPPYRLIEASYPDLGRIDDRQVTPKDFGLDSPPDSNKFIGNLKDLDHFTGEQSLTLRRRYRELLSIVFEKKWLIGGTRDLDQEEKIASEMRDILSKITPHDLVPYYKWLGRDLNHWFERAIPKKS